MKKDNFNLSVGGRSRNRFNISSYNFSLFNHFGYYFSFGLDAWLKLEYKLKDKHLFKSNIAIPLFSFNSRSPYLTADDQYFIDNYKHKGFNAFTNYIKGSEFQTWGKSQSFDLDMTYYYSISEKWDLGASYWLSMNFNQSPTRLTSIENIIYLTGRLKF